MRRWRRVPAAIAFAAVLAAGGLFVYMRASDPGPGPAPAGDPALAMVDVRLPDRDPRLDAGREDFERNCAVCHGPAGGGQLGIGPPLVHVVYEPGHHPDGAFHAAIRFGVRAHHWQFGDMPPVEGLNERRIEGIIAYVRALQRANGIF